METDVKSVNVEVSEAFIVKPDADELCRLCANTDNQLIPIFRGEGLEHNLSHKIETHLPIIKVTDVDKLPLQICYQCASTLISWHTLYEGCRVADKRLREILSIDEKLHQEDETYGDYVDDYRDDYGDETHESLPTSTPNTSNLESNTLKNSSTELTTLSDTKILNETESDGNDERYVAHDTRKRGPLTAKKRPASVAGSTDDKCVSEERAKMVKSKKIRCLATESPSARASSAASKSSPSCEKTRTVGKIEKSKCNICGAAFTHLDDLAWHRDTIHDASSATSVIRKSSRIEARASSKTKGARRVETIEIDLGDEKTEENAVLVADGGETAENSEDTACKKSTIVESVFHCHHCEHICKNKSAMNKHLRIHHPDESINGEKTIRQAILSCAICLRTFAHKANLRKHVITHNPLHNGPGVKVNRADQRWKKGYCCDICDRAFNNQRDILAHRDIVHSTAAPLEWMRFYECCCVVSYCDACGHYFKKKAFLNHDCRSDPEEVAERVQQLLESNPSFECDICSLCFHWKWMYRSHRESVHPNVSPIDWETLAKANVSIYCPSCLKAFADKDTLSKHRSTCIVNFENKVKRFDCSLCDRSFCRKFDFHRHLKSKHPDPELTVGVENSASRTKPNIPCPFCDIAMPTRNVVLKHIKIAHGIETDTPFVCVLCNKVFKRKATMETHNQIYHPKEENTEETEKILEEAKILLDGETAYHCNICNRNVLNSTRFVAHYRLHKMERKFTCDLCGKQTRTQHQLNTHVKIIHLDIRNFECDICNKSFHSKQSCEEHRRIHTGERPYSCEICGKTFIAMNALFTHKKFHNDFFAHSCSLCPKKFKVRRSLINHIRTHTGERPYKCDLCPKTFNNSSRFSYHKKVTHSDNRPFTCDQCGSCFKANKFLMRHMKLHTTRTHIQFRRRNNPAYFEKHATNAKKPVACLSKKSPLDTNANTKASNGGESGATETVTTTPVLYTVRTFRKIASKGVELENVLISSAATSDELTLADDTEPHFLADPLASDG